MQSEPASVPYPPEYPPEPWYLGGTLLVSVFRVPPEQLPAATFDAMPARHRLVVVGGRATVGVAFVRYTEGGVLAYDELLVAVAARRGSRLLRCSISQIWVNSPSSMAGGRALWAIPKRLGQFERSRSGHSICTSMSCDDQPVATLEAAVGRKLLPGRPRLPLASAQRLEGQEVVSRNLVLGEVRSMRTAWSFDPDGALGWLVGRMPVLSAALADSAVIFGMNVDRC